MDWPTLRRGVSFARRLGRELGRGQFAKSAVGSGAPFSSLTARADFIANKKYKPEPNPLTSEERATLDRLLAGMSRSGARTVGAHRQGRKSVEALLQSSGLWE